MGFACAPQLMGLVRGEPKSGQKHRANGRAILAEAGDARVSQSVTLDRTRSHLNQYTNYSNGFEAWDEMEKQANEYQTTFTDKNGVQRNRKLKSDAVCGYAVIFNPPEEVCFDWTDAQYQKFYDDSWNCLCEIEPRLFDDKNVLMSAEHFDEGIGDNDRHLHKFGIPKDENNKYCGNLLDAKLLSNINKNYPAMMRQRGWEMDDLDTTDWERYKEDEDYRLERKQKFRDNGKSVNKHITDKLNKELKKAQELTQQAQDTLDVAEQIKLEAEEEKRKNEADAKEILKKSMELKKRESAISAKEQEQQKKADEFQHKEDALDMQKKAQDVKDFELKAEANSLSNLWEKVLKPEKIRDDFMKSIRYKDGSTVYDRFVNYVNAEKAKMKARADGFADIEQHENDEMSL